MAKYIYCCSNICMPDIIKINITDIDPYEYIKIVNNSNCCTWKPPTPYKIEIVKKIQNAENKKDILFKVLKQHGHINISLDFFHISINNLIPYFDLIDGELYEPIQNINEVINYGNNTGCRDMPRCFKNGQRIRHKIGDNSWVGIYNTKLSAVCYDNQEFYTLNQFVMAHYAIVNPSRKTANAWRECECDINNKWVSTYSLPKN